MTNNDISRKFEIILEMIECELNFDLSDYALGAIIAQINTLHFCNYVSDQKSDELACRAYKQAGWDKEKSG